MARISETIARLKMLQAGLTTNAAGADDRLTDLDFGPNPGALRARTFVPEAMGPGGALVVVLHGCTQNAARYDHGSGWSELAERHGFALLYPEQPQANNPAACFNWFQPDDIRRGGGEAMSIHQMVLAMIDRHDLDPARIYVTGLSAGAAMSVAMLAAYPEMFAGGAIVAGLPYGCAASVNEALQCMRGNGVPSATALHAKVRNASKHKGPWPTLSVWHGTADHTVVPSNADAIVAQWRAVHDLPEAPAATETVGPHSRRVWRDTAGRDIVESWHIAGMGHGTPIDAGPGGCGRPGPFMLDVGLSSTQHIAHRWGLAPAPADANLRAAAPSKRTARRNPAAATAEPATAEPAAAGAGVGRVIEDALRAAGLMR